MRMEFCTNCGKRRGFKRAFGLGTVVMVVLTLSLWILAMPFYPARCINCGTSAVGNWFEGTEQPWFKILCALVGLVAVCFILGVLHRLL